MSAKSNARWIALAQATRVALQLLGLAILSHLIAPVEFGLVAMAMVVVNFANLIRDMGMAAAVIQRKELSDTETLTAFWFSTATGIALGTAVAILSPLVAFLFRTPALAPLLLMLALSFPAASLGAVPQALLERNSRFATIARIEILSGIVGLTCATSAAWLGAGAFALAAQMLTVTCLSAAQLFFAAGWRPRKFFISRQALTDIWGFSGGVIGFNLITYVSRNADSMIIGRVLGAAALGPYSLAYRLMLFPVQNLTMVASRALFPVFSRDQDQPKKISAVYLRAISVISMITAPLMAGVFVLREPLVNTVLGPQWSTVAELLRWLAPVGFIQSLTSTTGTVFMARGRTRLLLTVGVVNAVLQVSAFIIGSFWGLHGIVFCYFIANCLNLVPAIGCALHVIGLSLFEFVRAVLPQCLCALVMGFSVVMVKDMLHQPSLSDLEKLLPCVVVGVLSYVLLAAILQRQGLKELIAMRS